MKRILLLLAIGYVSFLQAEELRVRLYSQQKTDVVMVLPDSGGYTLVMDEGRIPLDPDKLVTISIKDDRIKIKAQGKEQFSRGIVRIEKNSPISSFRIRVDEDERIYDGTLEFRIQEGELFVINEVDLERYVGGVVESEAGHVRLPEFLKAQAVIARTYALKNLGKHREKNYDLNDEVDAQAFHSIAYSANNYLIWRAIYATKGEVLVDENEELIISAYHSNSGGQTMNSEDAWSSEVPYIRSTVDSFSVGMPHYDWEVALTKEEWLNYLISKLGPLDPEEDKSLWLIQQDVRISEITKFDRSLRLKDIRSHFKLPSSFFSVKDQGDHVILTGTGFGHGVGLSQEGAMKMSEQGFSYREILFYYYTQIKIVTP